MSKRRKFNAQFKADLVMSVLTGIKTQAEVCREHQLKPQLLGRWKTQLMENAHLVFQNGDGIGTHSHKENMANSYFAAITHQQTHSEHTDAIGKANTQRVNPRPADDQRQDRADADCQQSEGHKRSLALPPGCSHIGGTVLHKLRHGTPQHA